MIRASNCAAKTTDVASSVNKSASASKCFFVKSVNVRKSVKHLFLYVLTIGAVIATKAGFILGRIDHYHSVAEVVLLKASYVGMSA